MVLDTHPHCATTIKSHLSAAVRLARAFILTLLVAASLVYGRRTQPKIA